MPSLLCLISALTQAGGGDLLFRFASSVQSCYGEGRALQTALCVGSTLRVSGHTGFAPLTGVCAFPAYTAQAPGCSLWSGPCAACGSSFRVLHKSADSVVPPFCAFPGLSGSGSQRLGRTLPGCGAPFPSAAPARRWSGLRNSLYRNQGPVCSVGGGGFSGPEFAPFPSPYLLPPAGMGQLFSGVSQSLCFANCRQCVRAG